MAAEEASVVTIHSRVDLRAWLAANHGISAAVWLALWKQPHPGHVPYAEVVEELLCWGWIDSTPRTLDAARSRLMIAPRNPKSAWSAVNKAHVERARASGCMMPSGEAKVAAGQANGMWDFLNDVDALIDPPDLSAALAASGSIAFWAAQPRTIRRGTLEWIKTAKTPETRVKRIKDVIDSAREGLRPSPFRR